MSTSEQPILSLGLVGIGGAGQRLLEAAAETAYTGIRATVSPDSEMDKRSGITAAESYTELLRSTDINAVYLATPVHTHVALALRALQAGKHVLIEKPLGLTLKDIAPLLKISGGTQIAGTAVKKRFGEGIDRFRSMGWSLGANARIAYRWHIPPPPSSDWRYRPELSGGGVIMDLGSHVIDLLEYLIGPISRVKARTENGLGACLVESFAAIELDFLAGGIASIELSWHSTSASYEFTIENGSNRFCQSCLNSQEDQYWLSDSHGTRYFVGKRSAEYSGLLLAFDRAVRAQEHRLPSLHDGARNVTTIETIYRSAASNQPMDLQLRRC